MPRKPLKKRKNPTQTKNNRIRENLNQLIGIEDPDVLLFKLFRILKDTTRRPVVGQIYAFTYSPKTVNISYDAHPLVAVTDIFSWGFRGINFHWGETRQYSWDEVTSPLHTIYKEELADVQQLPFGKIQTNR